MLAIQSLLSHLKTLFLFSAFSFDIFPSSHHVTCFYYCPTFSPIASHNFRRPSPSCPDVFYAKLLIDLFFFLSLFFFGGTCFDTHSLTHPLSSPHDNRIPNDVSLPFISMIKYAYDIMHRSGSAVKAETYKKMCIRFSFATSVRGAIVCANYKLNEMRTGVLYIFFVVSSAVERAGFDNAHILCRHKRSISKFHLVIKPSINHIESSLKS